MEWGGADWGVVKWCGVGLGEIEIKWAGLRQDGVGGAGLEWGGVRLGWGGVGWLR